ncbi:hypothetical protein [Streptomyces sp. NPDC099088]|uniref:hypothetical protein n=1 Tax=Streptomyces sp. NPDC099088 TaxID=3366101 RepID=UPI00381432EF
MRDVLRRAIPELSSAGDLGKTLEFPQLRLQIVEGRNDRALELVDRGGEGEDGAVADDEEDAQGLALSSEASAGSGAR